MNREAVAGGELDSLAGCVNRIIGHRRPQPVAPVEVLGGHRLRGASRCLLLRRDRQAGLGIADADDVDPFLLRVEEVNPGLEHLLLDAALFAGAWISGLVCHHADIAGWDEGRVFGLALDLGAGLGAGVHIDDLDVVTILIDAVSPRCENLAEDAAIPLLVNQVGSFGQCLADLGNHDADLAGWNDLVLDDLGLVLQWRVEMTSAAGHDFEDAHLERAAGSIGLHERALERLGSIAERPGTLVADQQARSRRNLDPAEYPLPDSEVGNLHEDCDNQQGARNAAQR